MYSTSLTVLESRSRNSSIRIRMFPFHFVALPPLGAPARHPRYGYNHGYGYSNGYGNNDYVIALR